MQLAALLNKAYALKHGYQMHITNASQYESYLKTSDRERDWLKPKYIMSLRDQGCEWFAYLDSDAFFWMDQQKTSLEDWFAVMSPEDVSVNYEKHQQIRRENGGRYEWRDHDEYFIVGRNGVATTPTMLYPGTFLDTDTDYVCAGVFMVKNNDQGMKMMRDWLVGPRDPSLNQDEVDQAYEKYRREWSRDQRMLNRFIVPLHRKGVSVYSYLDLDHRNGNGIRHYWGDFNDIRVPSMIQALQDLSLL